MLKSSSDHERPETSGGIGNNHNGDGHDSSSSLSGDEANESDGVMSQVVTNNHDDIEAKEVNRSLAKAETKYVQVLRVVVLALMVGAAVAVAVIIYMYMKNAQKADLSDEFFYLSNRLVSGFHANTKMRFQVLDSFSLQVTVMAMATGQTWPFVTLDNFEVIGTAARSIIDSYYMALYPYVTEENRQAWQNYTAQNTYWLNESYTYQRDFFDTHKHTVGMKAPALERRRRLSTGRALQEEQAIREATFDGPNNISTEIYRYPNDEEEGVDFVVDEPIGPYIPIWQVSPARAAANIDINYNMYDPTYSFSYATAFEEIMKTNTGIFGAVWNVDQEGMVLEDDDYDFRPVPAAALFYPVFDTVLGGANRSAVAALELDVEFGALFSSVLPPNSDSLICVIKNTCGQTFSFEVSGELAIYVGPQDQHDPNFDHMVVESLLTDFDKDEDQNYNGVRINKNFCPWVLSVYGTKDMYDAHINNEPVMYLCAILGIFLLTCFVFVMYDCLVEYRQRKVQKTAENSEKIVASLFPKAFREKLYNENENKAKAAAKKQGLTSFQTTSKEVARFFSAEQAPGGPNYEGMGSLLNSPPMAELYPNCTVFFADIAGFTAWSSSRTPADVFTLLETLYGHFDNFARKHKVFKIETIGDCYVAVTGLPVAQPNHAVLMVKFARECLAGMCNYTVKLEGKLGPDTGGLALRVGLHSGPVTAGVLRGEKARFQLFGDTVNTTARMESTGQPGCIHVSQDTANILIAMGKKHWVEARPEKVYCKGKGDMQTHFVSVNTSAKSNSTPASEASTHDDEDMFDVEVAVAELDGGEAEDSRQGWVEKNYKRIGWVRGLLQDQLEIIGGLRGSMASEPKVWENVSSVSSTWVSWNGDMAKSLLSAGDNMPMDISGDLSREILELVAQIAYSLPRVPYHNFDQTCCVLMSLNRMFNQVSTDVESELKPSPLAKLACFFAALIRNLSPPVAPVVVRRQGDGFDLVHQSASESKSADAALELFKSDRFSGLREALCPNVSEFQNFWGIVQNLILATDASGGTLSEERDKRWDLSFGSNDHSTAPHEKVISFLEHILLMAEEGYAAQHCDNYVKWSNLLLDEYREMYQKGELHQDPDSFWHQSRLNYFDSFVLPLAQKIDSAGVLGTMGHEFYTYASQNRRELDSAEGIATLKESSHGSRGMQDSSSQRRQWSRPVSTSKNTPKKNKPKPAPRRMAPQVPKAATALKTPSSQPVPFLSNINENDNEHILDV